MRNYITTFLGADASERRTKHIYSDAWKRRLLWRRLLRRRLLLSQIDHASLDVYNVLADQILQGVVENVGGNVESVEFKQRMELMVAKEREDLLAGGLHLVFRQVVGLTAYADVAHATVL